ncbi:MAG: ATP-binding protein [Azovibrio sp.]
MMGILPRSLFWRLVWVLLAGLIITQLLSAALNYEERDQLLLHASGIQSAERIGDTVHLLDSLNGEERKHVASLLSVPPQFVSLDRSPVDIDVKAGENPQVRQFQHMLQNTLGQKRQMRVIRNVAQNVTAANEEPHTPGYGRRRAMMEGREFTPGMYHFSPGHPGAMGATGTFFLVQVRLQDGQWVTFETYVPKTSASLSLRLLATLLLLFLAVSVLSFIAVRWITRPLHALASAADALGRDINRPLLPETGPTEVRQAAHAFNQMQARLKRFIQDRSHIFAAMSHDLKTPITRLRLRAEMLDDAGQRERFEKDLKEMEAMVSQTLEFMGGLDGAQFGTQPRQAIDIMALLESLQADYEEVGQKVTINGHTRIPYMGVAPLLKRCLANLLDNAIFYGQEARIVVEDSPTCLTLSIQDEGQGIPEEEHEKAFEPFYRLEGSRNRETGGTGLGLTIARNIAHSHGGEISLHNLPQGGLEVWLKLPR